MYYFMKYLFLFFTVAITLFIASCDTSKKVYSNRDLKHLDKSDIYGSIQENYGSYTDFYTKFSCTAGINGSNKSFKGTIKLKKDSLIWISITPGLGLELFRVQISPDSIEFMDRLKGKYFRGNYSTINKLAGVELDYNTLQSIILNELFFYGGMQRDTAEMLNMMKYRKTPKAIRMSTHIERKLKNVLKENAYPNILYHDYHINNYCLRIQKAVIKDYAKGRSMDVNYSEFTEIEGITFPDLVEISINDTIHKKEFNLELDFYKTNFSKKLNFIYKIPDSYKQIH